MAILNSDERTFLTSVARVSYANPFLPERIDYEREALGAEFDESHANWNLLGDDPETHQINTTRIAQRAYPIIAGFQAQLKKGVAATAQEIELYEDTVLFLLFYNYAQRFKESIIDPKKGRTCDYYKEFCDYWSFFFDIPGYNLPQQREAAHIFACSFQVRRAFYYIFRAIIGRSSVAADLRTMV